MSFNSADPATVGARAAPMTLFSFRVTGATKEVFEPTNTLSLIFVLLFFLIK